MTGAAKPPAPCVGDVYLLDHDNGRAQPPPYSHPHVVTAVRVDANNTVVAVEVCTITSRQAAVAEPGNVMLQPGEGGLTQASVVVVTRFHDVEPQRLQQRLGSLPAARIQQILDGRRFVERAFQQR